MTTINGRMVNSRRKKFCEELHTGKSFGTDGKQKNLSIRQKSWRAGYVSGVNDSNSAVKNAVGLKQNERVPNNKIIKHNLIDIRQAANANVPTKKKKY